MTRTPTRIAKDEMIDKWSVALYAAVIAAKAAENTEDGGTCNLDSVAIDFSGWRQSDVELLARVAKTGFSDKLGGWMWKGHRFWNIHITGHGNRRSRMVEAAVKELKHRGIPATVYYQMD